ncbi:hypothetical protein GGR26_000976 [Lewinella marina]|uniref:Deoxyribose-phosphate aldolase n=1 Tax=Neolewinella marina TaxID=438751 RepID=A0A2G0CI40_9BACT|nr:DUF6503 family protein [Neolewinella marina]NJB85231.1 hypothetical protein [Neolewinella marina]PHK99636.1 hypothetical protein CGL56_00890 [Neolewinella marina]
MTTLTPSPTKSNSGNPRIFTTALLGLFLLLFLGTCGPANPNADSAATPDTAEAVIQRAVDAHGVAHFDSVEVNFAFRDRQYGIVTDHGRYTYSRSFTDSLGRPVRDVLTNEGLQRFRNDSLLQLTAKDSAAYAASVNSVRYFFMLPYGLSDPAVQAELLDTVSLEGKVYDRVRVTFAAEGGGTDHDDVYHYFFNRETGELDYLAYTFEADKGGIRFREAINKRRIDGVLVQDYVNYGINGDDRNIDDIARRFAAGELPKLSVIENTAVQFADRLAGDQ